MVELPTIRQVLQTAWEGHTLRVLTIFSTKCQGSQIAWKNHALQVPLEFTTEIQVLAFWQVEPVEHILMSYG